MRRHIAQELAGRRVGAPHPLDPLVVLLRAPPQRRRVAHAVDGVGEDRGDRGSRPGDGPVQGGAGLDRGSC